MSYSKPFPKDEYEQRINTVKQRMQEAGFDLLICQDPASMGWLTGFDGWSFYTPQAVLLHLEEASPIWSLWFFILGIAVFTMCFIPETKGKTLEELESIWD